MPLKHVKFENDSQYSNWDKWLVYIFAIRVSLQNYQSTNKPKPQKYPLIANANLKNNVKF